MTFPPPHRHRSGGKFSRECGGSTPLSTFYRPAPSGGYTKGLPAAKRTDKGTGDIAPEKLGEHFFTYGPYGASGSRQHLARATNIVQKALASGDYEGAIWLEGSPNVEDTTYWLSLVIDTTKPLLGNSAQRAHGTLSADGDGNIADSIEYITSRIWADSSGKDFVGSLMIQDNVLYSAREIQKGDATQISEGQSGAREGQEHGCRASAH